MYAFVAHVAGVDAAVGRGGLGEGDHFGGVGVDAGHVFEAGGEAHRAFAHGAIYQRLHPADFVRRGQPVDRAHHLAAHGVVTHERGNVEPEAELGDLVEPGGEIQFGAAAVSGDDGGDAIEQEIIAARIFLHAAFDVSVNIDEARGDDALAGVDGAGGGGAGEMSDGGDAAVLDGDVGALPGIATAIDDAGVADQDVVIRGDERGDQEDKGDEAHWDIFQHRWGGGEQGSVDLTRSRGGAEEDAEKYGESRTRGRIRPFPLARRGSGENGGQTGCGEPRPTAGG